MEVPRRERSLKRRLIIAVVLITLGIPLGWGFAIHRRADRLAVAQTAGERALDAFVLTHAEHLPFHENGVECLLRQGTAVDGKAGVFALRGDPKHVLSKYLESPAAPPGPVPNGALEEAERLQPWAAAMRGCASSARLELVEGLRAGDLRAVRTPYGRTKAGLETFFRWQALELQQLAAAGAPAEVRFERCTAALALIADTTFLAGARGVDTAHEGAKLLVPRCGDALSAATPEQRQAVGARWATLASRLVSAGHVVRWARYGGTGWYAVRAHEGWFERIPNALEWGREDRAYAELEAVADADVARRTAAIRAFDSEIRWDPHAISLEYQLKLDALDQLRAWLEALAAAAQDGGVPKLEPSLRR